MIELYLKIHKLTWKSSTFVWAKENSNNFRKTTTFKKIKQTRKLSSKIHKRQKTEAFEILKARKTWTYSKVEKIGMSTISKYSEMEKNGFQKCCDPEICFDHEIYRYSEKFRNPETDPYSRQLPKYRRNSKSRKTRKSIRFGE